MRARVLLADDHAVVGEGVRAMLTSEFEVVGLARTGLDLLQMARQLKPDVIVADIAMPLLNGLDAAERLREDQPHCPVIIMSAHESPAYVHAAQRAGARGYVLKSRSEELPKAIRTVLSGGAIFPASEHSPATASSERSSLLTAREQEILQLLADGKSGKEIASLAGLSVRTVEFHKYNIMNKLTLRTTAELVRYAHQEGLTLGW